MSVLRYELMDRIRPHCFFLGPVERALLARGAAEGRRTVAFVPGAFSQAPRLMRISSHPILFLLTQEKETGMAIKFRIVLLLSIQD